MRLMKGGMMYEQRDIILIPFPYSDLTGAKQRPAVIISNGKLKQDFICCLVTSNESAEGLPISESHYEKGKLPFKSWVKPHRLFTINEIIIKKKLCKIKKGLHKVIIDTINTYLE